jgi:hypothetical protein
MPFNPYLYLYVYVVVLPVVLATLTTASGEPSSHLAPFRAIDRTLLSFKLPLTTGAAAGGVYVYPIMTRAMRMATRAMAVFFLQR